jgi:predicted XRE-type DNA-binding protein
MSDERVVASSGNVFADLGLPDADKALAKADLARQIVRLIKRRDWTQAQAAQALSIDQPKVSALMRGRLAGFSTDRLIHYLNNLDQDVEIAVRPKAPGAQFAALRVTVQDAAPTETKTTPEADKAEPKSSRGPLTPDTLEVADAARARDALTVAGKQHQ